MFPQSPSRSDWCLRDPAIQEGGEIILGVLCSIGFFAKKQANPTSVPGIRAQFNLQDFEPNVKGGVGKYSLGGVSLTAQGHLMSAEVQKLALV